MKNVFYLALIVIFAVAFAGCEYCTECSQESAQPTTEEKCGSKTTARDFRDDYEAQCKEWIAHGVVTSCGCTDVKTGIIQ